MSVDAKYQNVPEQNRARMDSFVQAWGGELSFVAVVVVFYETAVGRDSFVKNLDSISEPFLRLIISKFGTLRKHYTR